METSAPITWTKSTHSGQQDCVEWRKGPTGIDVRDSKKAETAPALALAPDSWRAFVEHLAQRS
ncbi:DUF397 domain-containing protein (plasmid) [Embleya sp. NBC_00888]|uniref:DUF397 domain-containing protein n=1 Tax=Embleya sp. NBC_00888 TaxID=2975960 RepID=UPI002F9081A0|nr:DUF397 domain-containing protein [Embleya sp. NBC_00888]